MDIHTSLRCIVIAVVSATASSLCNAGTPADYAGKDLQHKDFINGSLNKANFQGADLRFANFKNATLKEANFQKADLRNARLSQANLEGADFTGADLTGADLRDAKARSTKFVGATIHLARATVIDVSKLNLDFRAEQSIMAAQEATSGSLTLHYADMRNCSIAGNAEGVDFRDADLRGADLSKVENLDKARLKGAKYDEHTQWKVTLETSGAVLVAGTAEPAGAETAANSPFIGKWLVLKGVEGAADNGVISILANHTFEWDPALSAATPQLLKGKWTEAGETIVLKDGEQGSAWTAVRAMYKDKPELHLKNDKNDQRVAVSE